MMISEIYKNFWLLVDRTGIKSGLTILYREGKNRAVHSLPTAFIELSEESERSCHGLRSLSNVYESYRRAVMVHAQAIPEFANQLYLRLYTAQNA
jgi:hypothetical protein